MVVQSIIFDKNYWTPHRASNWLLYHHLYPIKKMHETENYYRFRLEQPRKYARYYTKNIGNGIKLIISSQ